MTAKVYHLDLYGKRKEKYDTLESLSLADATLTELAPTAPYYFFVPKNTDGQAEYESGFSVWKIFPENVTGILTAIDKLAIHYTPEEAKNLTQKILNSPDPYTEFWIKDQRKHKKEARIVELRESYENTTPVKITYRPFDTRYMYYTKKTECWMNSPRYEVMKNLLQDNISVIIPRQAIADNWSHVQVTRNISDKRNHYSNKWIPIQCPLYLYSDSENLEWTTRTPNLNQAIWEKMSENVGRETTPEEVLDYIYAVLHSPSYREKYREFLKIDFPRVPYPKSRESFDVLVKLGGELRGLHLLESPKVEEYITTFPVAGTNEVEKITFIHPKLDPGSIDTKVEDAEINSAWQVWMNSTQYFGDVPEIAWNFYIWGYQPAQKWLKDRKWRVLTWEDISHYQQVVVALTETSRVMGEIDAVLEV